MSLMHSLRRKVTKSLYAPGLAQSHLAFWLSSAVLQTDRSFCSRVCNCGRTEWRRRPSLCSAVLGPQLGGIAQQGGELTSRAFPDESGAWAGIAILSDRHLVSQRSLGFLTAWGS